MAKIQSLRALALHTGFSLTTVSLAMKNSSRIKASTRQIIRETAKMGGYRPNAKIAAAMRQIRQPEDRRRFDVLAWLYLPYPIGWQPNHDYLKTMYLAAAERAASVGWQLQSFSLDNPGHPPHKIGQFLFFRGVRAAVIAPFHKKIDHLGVDYSRIAAVAVGYSLSEPGLSRVVRESIDSMGTLFLELKRRGYSRPGFVQSRNEHLKAHRLPLAAFRMAQEDLLLKHRLPPLTLQSFDSLREWLKRYRPDVVIADSPELLKVLRKMAIRIPGELGFVLTTRTQEDANIAGLDPNYALSAESAVDFAIQMAQHGEYGIPRIQKLISIGGTWRDGKTLA